MLSHYNSLLEDIYETIIILFREYQGLNLSDGRSGGYLTVRDEKDGSILFIIKLGEVPQDKLNKYLSFSMEKGERLFNNLKVGHVTSYQSRDIGYIKYGGAVAGKDYIFSFSGLPELGDEALMLYLAKELHQLRLPDSESMLYKLTGEDEDLLIEKYYLSHRQNEHYEKLAEALSKI